MTARHCGHHRMMSVSFVGMISFVLLAALWPSSVLSTPQLSGGIKQFEAKAAIYGGSTVIPESYPFVASIYVSGNISCGAAILTPSWLVTAAHCLVQPDSSVGSIKAIPRAPITAMTVGVGSVQNSTKYPIAVKRTLVSPIYNPVNNTNDIALIELDTVLTFNSTVQPIHISKSRISSGQEVTALGWGYTQNKTMSNTLLSVDLETAPDSKCYAGYPEWKGQNADLVCTGNTPGKDTCYGDSGGPLVRGTPSGYPNAGKHVLVAVTSFGLNTDNVLSTECGSKNGLGFYTHVYRYADWITQTTGANATEMLIGSAPSQKQFSMTSLMFGSAIVVPLLTAIVSGFD